MWLATAIKKIRESVNFLGDLLVKTERLKRVRLAPNLVLIALLAIHTGTNTV